MTGTSLGPAHDLAKRLKNIETAIQQLQTRDVLINSSIGAGGLTVNDGGSIAINDGGSLNIAGGGEAYVNGLALSAVTAANIGATASNYPVGTSSSPATSQVIHVPAGYTNAIVMCNGEAQFANNTSSSQYGQAFVTVAASTGNITQTGPFMDVAIAAGGINTITAAASAVITGINAGGGQTIEIDGHVLCGSALSQNAYNVFALAGIIIFLA